MKTTIFNVDGMHCSHCENAVKNAVSALSGVSGVIVNLEAKTVTITHGEQVTTGMIKAEIEDQGFDVFV